MKDLQIKWLGLKKKDAIRMAEELVKRASELE